MSINNAHTKRSCNEGYYARCVLTAKHPINSVLTRMTQDRDVQRVMLWLGYIDTDDMEER